MRTLWIAPPTVLIAGSMAAWYQLRRIAVERFLLAAAAEQLASDRDGLSRLNGATQRAHASLEGLERR